MGIQPGEYRWTILLNEKGRILDVVAVVMIETEEFLLLCGPEHQQTYQWLRRNVFIENVRILNESEKWNVQIVRSTDPVAVVHNASFPDVYFELYGAGLAEAIEEDVIALPYFPLGGFQWGIVAHTGNRLAIPSGDVEEYHRSRIAYGLGDYGAEWTSDFNPFEVGLKKLVSLDKGCYIGQEVLMRIESYKKQARSLTAFTTREEVHTGDTLRSDERVVGIVTSVVYDRSSAVFCGLAVVRNEILQNEHCSSVQPPIQFVKFPLEFLWQKC